ncbi:hypothetical protein XaC1_72 [Xanthomonas phage XaC1]|nr:hypothetical protein XaC1_72 [Xanthomonas phage XaC1]
MKNYINDGLHDDVPKLKLILEYLYDMDKYSQRDFETINVLCDTHGKVVYCKAKSTKHGVYNALVAFNKDGSPLVDFSTSVNRISLLGSSRITHNVLSNEYLVQDIETKFSEVLTEEQVIDDYFALSTTMDAELLDMVLLHANLYRELSYEFQKLNIALFKNCIGMIPKFYDELSK